jgi:hypothetical protein
MYNFFVADEVPVPSWRMTPPKDKELIAKLEKAYFDSGYEIKAMLRTLFTSGAFKADSARFARVKSPAEMVVSLMRMVGEHRGEIKPGLFEIAQEPKYMGMDLMNPPTVEGWHTGHEWIDSGTLVERINFAADQIGNTKLPGVKDIINRLGSENVVGPEQLVDRCLEMVGGYELAEETRKQLIEHAQKGGQLRPGTEGYSNQVGEILQLIVATQEYQFA